tara:strand:+ start:2843 stop:4006 length:1164 start_codon:yes stop_codon:yes gene_type:complete
LLSQRVKNLNNKKIKILGSGPTGSLLALSLASNNYDVVLVEPLSDASLCAKEKGYAITQSSRKIFEEYNLWIDIEKYASGFNSLSIIDDQLSQSVIIRKNDLKRFNKDQNNIGWVIEHKHLMQVLLDKINKNKHILKVNISSTPNNFFDFILAADGRDSSTRKDWGIKYFKRFYKQRCISFQAILKNIPDARAYEIFRHEGPLALLPIKNNVYQVIWFSTISETKAKLKLSKSKLLERLSAILPDEIKPEIIVSEISNYSVAQAFALPKFNHFNNILVGDAAHSFHPVGGQGLNSCIRDVYELSDMIRNYDNLSIFTRKIFSLSFFLSRCNDIISLLLFTDFLIKLFSNKFSFLYPLRILIFYLLRKIKFIRINVFSLMTDSMKKYD